MLKSSERQDLMYGLEELQEAGSVPVHLQIAGGAGETRMLRVTQCSSKALSSLLAHVARVNAGHEQADLPILTEIRDGALIIS